MDGPASVAAGNGMSKEGDGFLSRVSERAKATRLGNITAARSVADAVRTSLGPRGMDKMVQTETGDVLVTNDGATILEKMNVQHPAAKTLVQLSKAQDIEAGDGTTSVVVICGALLEASLELLEIGIHPTIISECFQIGLDKSMGVLESMSSPVDLENREELVRAASTSLNSKVVAQHASLLAPLSVDAVLSIAGDERQGADLRNIRIVKKLAGTVDETELIPGLLLNQSAESGASGPTRIEKAKIALIQFQLSPPKTDMENSVVVQDYAAMDRILKEERTYILQLVKKIKCR
uniref:T-complex protein 1 subunit delta n=1 Tax=Rhodosorus marinus TaxID=101924 RepID=A0A7S2ZJ76_9RHOD